MHDYLESMTSNKVLMKILMKYMTFFQEGSILSYFLLLVKYIPVLIITHEWKINKNYGLNTIFGKLTFSNYIRKETDEIFSNILIYFLILINFSGFLYFYISYSKLKNFDVKFKQYKKYLLKSLYILCFLNFFCVQYFYEICTLLICKNLPNSLINTKESKTNSIIIYFSVPVCIFCFFLVLFQNYIFTLINFRPYYVKNTYFANRINSLGYKNIFYPLLMIIVALEEYLGLKPVIIVKIILRIYYIYHFIIILLNYHLKIYYVELFISSFCFVSVLIEFLFIKDFFNNSDVEDILINPQNYSLIYQSYFIYSKICLQVLIASIICVLGKILERNFLTFFFENIRGRFSYCFYNKNFEMMNRLKNGEDQKDILCTICQNISLHVEKCTNSDCLCLNYKKDLKERNHFDSEVFLEILKNLLEDNLSKNLKKNKYTNSEIYSKYLMVETIHSLYFKKHYAKCFFNIEKIQRESFYKKNFYLRMQLFWLKYEVIVDFIKFNKTSPSTTFRKMGENYEKYNKYKDLESSFENIFSDYKNLIILFNSKKLTFTDYYKFLELLSNSINESYKLIKYIMANHDQHNSLFIRKIDFITNFLNGNNQFIPAHKMNYYLCLTEDDKSEKLIVKHTKKKEFLIDYISPKLAEQLSLKTSDIVGNDIHKFMSSQFVEFHYSHIVGHIKNNRLLIKNKEIYFVDKYGYCKNYYVDGSILITLSGEILVYIEVNPICEVYKEKNISFLSCDEEGEIIAINKQFAENFYIDINVKNIVQPNVFKSILTINKRKLKFKHNFVNLKYPYDKMIKNIRSIDYSKLWDFNNQTYFKYLENLNIDKFPIIERVNSQLQIVKRNLQECFYFYDIKITLDLNAIDLSMSRSIKDLQFTNIPIHLQTTLSINYKEENPINLKKMKLLKKKSALSINKEFNSIKTLSMMIRSMGWKNDIKEVQRKEEVHTHLKRRMHEIDLVKTENLKYKNSFVRMIIFIIFILSFFIFLGDFTMRIFDQVEIFANMKLDIFKLQQINYYIINSIFSLNLITGDIQPKSIIIKNLNYSTKVDNSFSYHLTNLMNRRNDYQDTFHKFYGSYLNLDDFVMNNIIVILNNEIIFKNIKNDLTITYKNFTFFDILDYDYRGVSKILSPSGNKENYTSNDLSDIEENKFLFYGPDKNKIFMKLMDQSNIISKNPFNELQYSMPTLRDKNIFYFLENSLIGFKSLYDIIKNNFDFFFDDLIAYYKIKLIMIFLTICIIIIGFFIYEGISFYINYEKVFTKFFILHDILKHYMDVLFIKIELLEELFQDFTVHNRKKYTKLINDEKYMGKKLSNTETLKSSITHFKTKFLNSKENKNLHRRNSLKKSVKSSRLLDYNDNILLSQNHLGNELNTNKNKIAIYNKPSEILKGTNFLKKPTLSLNNSNKRVNNAIEFSESAVNYNNFHKNKINNLGIIYENNNYDSNNFQEEFFKKEDKSSFELSNIIKKEDEFSNFAHGESWKNFEFHSNLLSKKNLIENAQNKLSDKKSNLYEINIIESKNLDEEIKKESNTNFNQKFTQNFKSNTKIGNVSTLSSFNKTDTNFLNTLNTNTDLNKESKKEIEYNGEEGTTYFIKKSKRFYILLSIFWTLLLLTICLVVINIDDTGKRFEKIKMFTSYSEIFYKRILLFTEVIMIYQISIFKKDSSYLIENSKIYLDKIYSDYQSLNKQFLDLNSNQYQLLINLKSLETQINLRDNFCKYLSQEKFQNNPNNNKSQLISDYFDLCQQISQNSFSIGFSDAAKNLFNYMNMQNGDLINFFNRIKSDNSEFPEDKLKYFMNDFYYVFSFLNHDRIIYDLFKVLDLKIQNSIDSLLSELENLNTFIFYFLYVFIILLGVFSIYKTKSLIHDSDKLINFMTNVVESGVKFSNIIDYK